MTLQPIRLIFSLPFFLTCTLLFGESSNDTIDVKHYNLFLEIDLIDQSIKGEEQITLKPSPPATTITLDAGDLLIEGVSGDNVSGFEKSGNNLIIQLHKSIQSTIDLTYSGTPKSGLLFNQESKTAYTVFSTDQWMICNMAPSDKATLSLTIQVDTTFEVIASGELIEKVSKNNQSVYSWQQNFGSPAYTFGFVVGEFQQFKEESNGLIFRYLAQKNTPSELSTIFKHTPETFIFLQNIAGVNYPLSSYPQAIVGNHYQEMSGFCVLKDSYGDLILKDSTEINLITHEMAHQWWGNQITCESWNHFWLNEGFATFLSAAYNEVRFGKEKYLENIDAYKEVYEGVREKGNDKPLVFESWSNPTGDDRRLVYFKGAYVLHLLRLHMGDEQFWNGVKYYSQTYFGKTVNTKQFQQAMEYSSKMDLDAFFEEWIY